MFLRCRRSFRPDRYDFGFLFIKSSRVVADEASPVRIFPAVIDHDTGQVVFQLAADGFESRQMKVEVAVHQYEKFIAFARSTDMPGFDIR